MDIEDEEVQEVTTVVVEIGVEEGGERVAAEGGEAGELEELCSWLLRYGKHGVLGLERGMGKWRRWCLIPRWTHTRSTFELCLQQRLLSKSLLANE